MLFGTFWIGSPNFMFLSVNFEDHPSPHHFNGNLILNKRNLGAGMMETCDYSRLAGLVKELYARLTLAQSQTSNIKPSHRL
jgi:hypothetical protein